MLKNYIAAKLRGNIPLDTLGVLADCLKVEPYILLKIHQYKTLPKRVNMK